MKRQRPNTTAKKTPRRKGRRTNRLTLVTGNILVLAVLLFIGGAVGEVYYRYIYDSTDSFGLTLVCKRWFERHYHENQSGFRDSVDYKNRILPGKQRITFVGDSFTAGHGVKDVEKRFTNILRNSSGSNREIHATAANGWDTGAELALVSELVNSNYEMDIVVLVYVLNDISDIVAQWQDILRRIYGEVPQKNWLLEHSYFVNMVYYRIKAATDPDMANYYGFVRDAYEGPEWDKQKRRLAKMARTARSKGVHFAVVTFPFLHALGKSYEYAAVHRKLDAFWREQGVPHLDLWPLYTDYKPKELVVGKFDAHPNEFAHELAAQAIEAFLAERLPQG